MGLMFIFEGMPYFLSPDKMRQWIASVAEMPDAVLRRTGFLLMIIGLCVIYMVRQG